MDYNTLAFSIIAEAVDAKSAAIEAARAALERDFAQAEACMEQCERSLSGAHQEQTDMLRAELSGNKQEVGLLMVHAQDHLSGAGLMRDMSGLIIELCKQIAKLEGEK